MIEEIMKPHGDVEIIIEGLDGSFTKLVKKIYVRNTILATGRLALAASIANDFEGPYNFFVHQMIFGDGGTTAGTPLYVQSSRNSLFGTTRASKFVSASIDPNNQSQVTFTSVLTFNDANGYSLNEMALVMNTGDFYSMTTFSDINKTSAVQITFNWTISFI
jgi:hypothetical protein